MHAGCGQETLEANSHRFDTLFDTPERRGLLEFHAPVWGDGALKHVIRLHAQDTPSFAAKESRRFTPTQATPLRSRA